MQNAQANMTQCMLLAYVLRIKYKEKEKKKRKRETREREERQIYTILKSKH